MAELPITRGVFLCENVIVEELTRNVSLINCFTRRVVDSFPTPPQQFNVFAIFTNGNGTIPVRLVVTDMRDDRDLFEFVSTLRFTGPLQELRTLIPVRNFVFDEGGVYEIMLESGGEPLARTRLELLTRKDES